MKLNKFAALTLVFASFTMLSPDRVWANNIPEATLCELELLSPENQTARLYLALRDAHATPRIVSANIKAYGLSNESDRLKVAKTIAERPVDFYSHSLSNGIYYFDITNPSDLIMLAKTAASQGDPYILESIKNFGIRNQKTLVEILEIALKSKKNVRQTASIMQDFLKEIPDELLSAARIYLKYGEESISHFFQHFKIQDERTRFEFAQAAADQVKGYQEIFHIENFSLSEENEIKIAKRLASEDRNFSEQFQVYKIRNENARIEIAKIAAPLDPHLSANIRKFQIQDKKALLEIAKLHATASFSNGYTTDFGYFEIEKESDRIDVARVLAANPEQGSDHIDQLEISDRHALLELARISAKTSGPAVLVRIKTFNLAEEHLREIVELSFKHKNVNYFSRFVAGIDVVWLVSRFGDATGHPFMLLPYVPMTNELIHKYSTLLGLHFDPHQPVEVLQALLEKGNLSEFAPLLLDRSRHAEVSIRLFQEIFKVGYKSHSEALKILRSRMDSLSLIEIALGLPDHSLDVWAQLSNDRRNTFYELALELARLKPQLFVNSPHLAKVLIKKSGYQILQLIRDIYQLDPSSYDDLIPLFANPDRLLENLKSVYAEKFKNLFQDPNLNFNYDQLLQLKEKWVNLDPILTLMARFNGNTQWKKETPILTQIFQAVLRDDFDNLKFHKGFSGIDERLQRKQVEFLSEIELEAWKKVRAEVEVVDLSQLSQSQSDQPYYDILNDNLKLHLQPLKLPLVGIQEMNSIDFKTILSRPVEPEGVYADLRKNYSNIQIIYQIVEFLDSQHPSESEAVLNFFADHLPYLLPGEVSLPQIGNDIASMLKAIPKEMPKQNGIVIVFTATLKDAKSLLTVGDLVDASSCQNYKTGSMIQTLLGYVLDANVQAVVSYALGINLFKNEKEFLQVADLIKKDPSSITFDPDKQQFTIQDANLKIISKTVNKGYRRQILKLGQTKGGRPGLHLERPYVQNHAAQIVMKIQIERIKKALDLELKAQIGPIQIPRSRNVGGVYSDSSGGVNTEAYEIQ